MRENVRKKNDISSGRRCRAAFCACFAVGILLACLLAGCGRGEEDLYHLDGLGEAQGGAGGKAEASYGSSPIGTSASGATSPTGTSASGGSSTTGEEASDGSSASGAEALAEEVIYVYVCGAVEEPGVVALPKGSRAEAGVEAAGGMREDADADYVNLAAPLSDGEKLYIPTLDESPGLMAQDGGGGQGGLVNINTADSALLCTLPGIGASRAGDIIAYREANGAFGTIEDIMKVPGIKDSVFEKLKSLITV